MQLDSEASQLALDKYLHLATRFKTLIQRKPEGAKRFLQEVNTRWSMYEYMAAKGTEKKI